jgi:hypothetical protein
MVLVCGAVLWAAPQARAEIIVVPSLEWLTCAAETVVVGTVEKVTTTRGPGAVRYHNVTVRVERVIKGKQAPRLVFCLRTIAEESPVPVWRKAKDGVLFFLTVSKDHGREKHLDGMLVPVSQHMPMSVIDLAASKERLIDRHFQQIRGRKAILEVVRHAAKVQAEYRKANPKAKLNAAIRSVPFDSDVFQALWAGSSVCLQVPDFMAPPRKAR